MQQVTLEIMEFIERNILPKYNNFGKSHGLQHVMRVIDNSIQLAHLTGADVNIAYVVAAYHDLGMSGPRAIHHITSGKILSSDNRLKKWFSDDQLKIMKEAVEDHRASSSHAPRSLYGKIVAEADRDLDPETVFTRAVEFGLENEPLKNKEEQWTRFQKHMNEKYSFNGYIHLWIPGSPNANNLKTIQNIISDDELLRTEFERIYNKEIVE
ncbi:HD domain-containing protein [Prevotella sp.]|uniref:HD domain-containing protein n=1 Tax=Prevotella sp. TaxID=59823 RepID=UPI003DA691CC